MAVNDEAEIAGQQQRLFRAAVAALSVSASWTYPNGWHLTVAVRHEGEEWCDGHRETYGHLSRRELLDVVSAELSRILEVSEVGPKA